MSVIGKKPFVNKIIDSLNKSQVSTVIGLLDNLGEVTHVSFKTLSDANKGISHVVFNLDEVQNKNVEGILIYIDSSHCGLFSFNSTSGNMLEFEIDPVGKSYIQQYEHLTVEKLRQVCGDKVADIEVGDVTADDINSGTAENGKVLMADGSGGSAWGWTTPKYSVTNLTDLTAAQLASLKVGEVIQVGDVAWVCYYNDIGSQTLVSLGELDLGKYKTADYIQGTGWSYKEYDLSNKASVYEINSDSFLVEGNAFDIEEFAGVKEGDIILNDYDAYTFYIVTKVAASDISIAGLDEENTVITVQFVKMLQGGDYYWLVDGVYTTSAGTKLYKHHIQMDDTYDHYVDFYIISWQSTAYTFDDLNTNISVGRDAIIISKEMNDLWLFLPMSINYDPINLELYATENGSNEVTIAFDADPTLTDNVTPL
ncbi:MAG: hypothetical protein K5765_06785 [Clostridia bacterium]|nr:hypothetical protein [Clostridia bacterium]